MTSGNPVIVKLWKWAGEASCSLQGGNEPCHSLMSGSHPGHSGLVPAPCLSPFPHIPETFACLIILKNYFYPKLWNTYNALCAYLIEDTILYAFFSDLHKKHRKHKYYPSFVREKTEATEKISDLPEVRKSVAEPSSNTPSRNPPHSTTQLTSGKCQSPWQPSGSQTLRFFCLIFMALPVQSNSVSSSNTKLHPLRADASDAVMGPYARPQYSQLQNEAHHSSTKRQ